jgi:hypothetical protein
MEIDGKLKPRSLSTGKRKRTAKLSPLRCSNCTKQNGLAIKVSLKAGELRENEGEPNDRGDFVPLTVPIDRVLP